MAYKISRMFGKQATQLCTMKWESNRYDHWLCDCPNVELRQKQVIQVGLRTFTKERKD